MGLRLFFLPNFPGARFIQGHTFIPDSRVVIDKRKNSNLKLCLIVLTECWCTSWALGHNDALMAAVGRAARTAWAAWACLGSLSGPFGPCLLKHFLLFDYADVC